MSEMVWIGKNRLMGEIISIKEDQTIVQAFEDTTGLRLGEMIEGTGKPMAARLSPGLLGNVFDGTGRPLTSKGDALWEVQMLVKKGDRVSPGEVIAEVQETPAIVHRIMIPPGPFLSEILPFEAPGGEVSFAVQSGSYGANDTLAVVNDIPIKMTQFWPIRVPRPSKRRVRPSQPLITGQRVIDTFFPIAKGGTAAIPGGFGTGKTITQHQLAKWANADIIVYIGCGERGNEMTEVLEDFAKLTDPRTGRPLMERTVLIANTSNMPVAAREASIYMGVTIAEYYRDMGYHTAIMADSTSRWAEALRELSGRMEEMPAEEGYPSYLASRLASFYQRVGYVESLNGLEGSVTIVGAVSPQGTDFSEPVTLQTKRFVRCFWALDRNLAYERHFPAINWLNSYSGYTEDLSEWYAKEVSPDFEACKNALFNILYEESQLQEIVKLVGEEVLPEEQRAILEIAKTIRQRYLQQNAYHPDEAYVSLDKQFKMMKEILEEFKCNTLNYPQSTVL